MEICGAGGGAVGNKYEKMETIASEIYLLFLKNLFYDYYCKRF